MVPSWLQMLREASISVAALVTASVAVLGLRAWKSQLHGESGYEQARLVLRAVLEFQEAFAKARFPFWETDEDADVRRRLQALSAAFENLKEQAREAAILWGPEMPYGILFRMTRYFGRAVGALRGRIHDRPRRESDFFSWIPAEEGDFGLGRSVNAISRMLDPYLGRRRHPVRRFLRMFFLAGEKSRGVAMNKRQVRILLWMAILLSLVPLGLGVFLLDSYDWGLAALLGWLLIFGGPILLIGGALLIRAGSK